MALDLTLTKRLAYIGDPTTVNDARTSQACALVNDMTGLAADSYKQKTRFFLHYGPIAGASDYNNDKYYYPLIKGGTLSFYRENPNNTSANSASIMYVIDHGDGLKTHYCTPYITLTGTPWRLKFSNGTSIDTTKIGTVLPDGDYLYFEPEYYYGFGKMDTYIAIENNGTFIDPRTLPGGTNPNIIPALTSFWQAPMTNVKGKYANYVNPLAFLDATTQVLGNADTPFHSDNATMAVEYGSAVLLKEAFWTSIPVQYQASAKFQINQVSGFWLDNTYYRTTKSFRWTIDNSIWFQVNLSTDIVIGTGTSPLPIESKVFTYANKTGADQVLGTWNGVATIIVIGNDTNTVFLNANLNTDTFNIMKSSGGGGFDPDPGEDPSSGGGNQNWGQGNTTVSTTGGSYDDTSDVIDNGTSGSTKAGQAYNNYFVLNLAQVLEVKEKIWGLTLPFLTKPSDGIISLLCFPFDLSSRSFNTNDPDILVGNSFMTLSTPVWMLNANYNNLLDFGSFKLDPYFAGFQDYAPYTKIQIYLPFIGIKELDPTYVQDKTLSLKYYVNFTNGSCIAAIFSDGVLYQRYNGQVAQSVPLTQVNNNLIEATASIALQAAGAVATGGATMVAGLASAALGTVAAARPQISGSAGGGGECELSLPLQAYLIIERPQCAIPQTYNHEKGRPALINKELSKCKGFTQMANPQLTAKCTSAENEMINNLLKNGVIINA